MLTALNLIQLVLYIALLALAGQGVLHVLAGASRASNPFYKLLQLVGSPFVNGLRHLVPRALGATQVALFTVVLLLVLYVIVTLARADWCLSHGLLGQAGCR